MHLQISNSLGSRAYVDSRAPHSLVDYCISMLEKNREKPIAEVLGDKKTPPTGDKGSNYYNFYEIKKK